jgi:ribosomal protein S18 acetylase RimI-like enzyme
MGHVLEDLSSAALIKAIKANLFAWYEYLGQSPIADHRVGPPLTWVLTPIHHPFMSNVFRTDIPPADADQTITDALAYFSSKDVTDVSWWVEPDSQPADLAERLVARGLTYYEGIPGMAADLLALHEEERAPADLAIEAVTDHAGLSLWIETHQRSAQPPDDWAEVLATLFSDMGSELPIRRYVGRRGGEPVAVSELFLAAGVAGVYCVGTLPEARQQGIGAAMTLAALRDARALGYRIGILHSSAMGFHVYQRLGFQELCRMGKFEWQAKPVSA